MITNTVYYLILLSFCAGYMFSIMIAEVPPARRLIAIIGLICLTVGILTHPLVNIL